MMKIGLSPRMGQGPVTFCPIGMTKHTAHAYCKRIPGYGKAGKANSTAEHNLPLTYHGLRTYCPLSPRLLHSCPVRSERIEIPVAARGDIRLIIGIIPLLFEKTFTTGGPPQPIAAGWNGDRLGNGQRGDISLYMKGKRKRTVIPNHGDRYLQRFGWSREKRNELHYHVLRADDCPAGSARQLPQTYIVCP